MHQLKRNKMSQLWLWGSLVELLVGGVAAGCHWSVSVVLGGVAGRPQFPILPGQGAHTLLWGKTGLSCCYEGLPGVALLA